MLGLQLGHAVFEHAANSITLAKLFLITLSEPPNENRE